MIIGLDCSTTCCGYSFFDGIKIIDAGFLDISKLKTNKEKAFFIVNFLKSNPNFVSIKEIKLEAALSGFIRGRTSQQVVILLSRFNAILEYILEEQLKVPVILISANTARKRVLGKAFIKGMSAKEYVKLELPKKVPYITTFFKNNSRGNPDKKNEDLCDAIVISLS